MKTFKSSGFNGLAIRLDSKGIHLIKSGIFGSKDDFYNYGSKSFLSSSTSFVGSTTINFGSDKIKGFSKIQAKEIEKIYALGASGNYVELIDLVGVDGQEFVNTPEYKIAIDKLKADWLQKEADKAAKVATEALKAQAAAAQAAASAAQAYDRHQNAANKAIHNAAVSAIKGAVPPINISMFVAVNGQQQGPYDMAGLSQLVQQGILTPNTMVWKEGLSGWVSASSLSELQSVFGNSSNPSVVPPAQ